MSLISYAQNAEDVLLWRALGHVASGFYIDVGANDPEENSVTKAFYDAGWRGINIEPMPSCLPALAHGRPRDINLAVACGAAEGSITLFDTPAVNGWASTDAATAASHRADGVVIVEHQVPLRTLTSICAEHAPEQIHFLKIDVEGYEAEVLRGIDLQRWRPWVLVIEATLPNRRTTNHAQWEGLVVPHGYRYAWFDGLNRYYVAAEHPDLLAALSVQPNVFDDYLHHHMEKAWRRVDELQAELTQATANRPTTSAAPAAPAAPAAGATMSVSVAPVRGAVPIQGAVPVQSTLPVQGAAPTPGAVPRQPPVPPQPTVLAMPPLTLTAAATAVPQELAHSVTLLAETRVQLLRAQQQNRAVRTALREADRQRALAQQNAARAAQQQLKTAALVQQLQDRVAALESSWSWRVTAPLRMVNYYRQPHHLLGLPRRAVRAGVLWVAQQPTLRKLGFGLLRRLPGRGERLLGWYGRLRDNGPGNADNLAPGVPPAVAHLPQTVRAVLADLERPGTGQVPD